MSRQDVSAFALRAPDVALVGRHARQRRPERRERPGRRERIQGLFWERFLLGDGLHVHHRRVGRHRNGFGDGSDLEGRVDRRGEPRGNVNAFPTNRAEARQRKCDGVHAWAQLFDFVLPRAVADRRAGLLNQDGAGRFNRDAWEDGTRAVPHDARNRAELRRAQRRKDEHR